MWLVQKQPVHRKFFAAPVSFAVAFQLITGFVTIVAPFLIAFFTSGFWFKHNVIEVQPIVTLRPEVVVYLDVNSTTYVQYSTLPGFRLLDHANMRLPVIKTVSSDSDADGIVDQFRITLEMQAKEGEDFMGIKLVYLFDCELRTQKATLLQSAIIIDESTMRPASRLHVSGNILIQAKAPLRPSFRHFPLISQGAIADGVVDYIYIVDRIMSANVTAIFQAPYPIWTTGRAPDRAFVAELVVNVPTQSIPYQPGIAEVLKWAFVQYMAFFIPVCYLMRMLRRAAFESNLVGAVTVPLRTSDSGHPKGSMQ